MEWSKLYGPDNQPSETDIAEYVKSPLWEELNGFLRGSYETEPVLSYSRCSGQPGWNAKYRKAGRTLCTLYPMPGFFIALVVIGAKESGETELMLPVCSEYTQRLYAKTPFVMGGRWLMIRVADEAVLDDAKRLIQLRRPVRQKAR